MKLHSSSLSIADNSLSIEGRDRACPPAVNAVRDEYEHFKKQLEHNRTKYQIVDEAEQPDGSIVIHVKSSTTTTTVMNI